MGVHKVSAFHPFIFQKSGKSTIIRNVAVPRHFVAYLVFISMDLNFPVFATGVRIFRASNDVGPLFLGPGSIRILEINTR
jgi:hypothetical protein